MVIETNVSKSKQMPTLCTPRIDFHLFHIPMKKCNLGSCCCDIMQPQNTNLQHDHLGLPLYFACNHNLPSTEYSIFHNLIGSYLIMIPNAWQVQRMLNERLFLQQCESQRSPLCRTPCMNACRSWD